MVNHTRAGLLGDATDPLLSPTRPFPGAIANWSEWVNEPLDPEFCDKLRRNTANGRVERLLARALAPPRKRARPRKPVLEPEATKDLFS